MLLAFLAVMREGFETVLFFSALVYSGQGVDLHEGLMGALGGLLLSVVLVWGLLRSTRKVALAPFFRWTGLLIIIIAAGLLSSAVNMLQATGSSPSGRRLSSTSVTFSTIRGIWYLPARPVWLQCLTSRPAVADLGQLPGDLRHRLASQLSSPAPALIAQRGAAADDKAAQRGRLFNVFFWSAFRITES